jgi:hypothetical protein
MESDEYALVLLLAGRAPQVWPTAGRNKESFEAHCATSGVAVIRVYPSPQEAVAALCLPLPDCFMYNRRSCAP